jgi:hypothetical protein
VIELCELQYDNLSRSAYLENMRTAYWNTPFNFRGLILVIALTCPCHITQWNIVSVEEGTRNYVKCIF